MNTGRLAEHAERTIELAEDAKLSEGGLGEAGKR